MSLYGRFFSPDEKTTLRKVLDRTSVLTAVECLAYITNEKQAMHELFSKKAKNGRYVYDMVIDSPNLDSTRRIIEGVLTIRPKV